MDIKVFDIQQDALRMLEPKVDSTDLEKEQYYLETLQNNEWGFNKGLSKFVIKMNDMIYYMRVELIQFRCCGQPPAKLVGYVLEKENLSNGEVQTKIVQKDMEEMPFKIEDETAFMSYYYRHVQ